jgi:hypothetical protein
MNKCFIKWKDIKTYNINIKTKKHKIVGSVVCKSYLKEWKKWLDGLDPSSSFLNLHKTSGGQYLIDKQHHKRNQTIMQGEVITHGN